MGLLAQPDPRGRKALLGQQALPDQLELRELVGQQDLPDLLARLELLALQAPQVPQGRHQTLQARQVRPDPRVRRARPAQYTQQVARLTASSMKTSRRSPLTTQLRQATML